jgi:hypothetical protein
MKENTEVRYRYRTSTEGVIYSTGTDSGVPMKQVAEINSPCTLSETFLFNYLHKNKKEKLVSTIVHTPIHQVIFFFIKLHG